MILYLWKKKLVFKLDVEPDLIVNAYPESVERILINLLSNAVKYTHDNGVITLRTYKDSTNVCIEVTDTGIGISKDELRNIFDRFSRLTQTINDSRGSGVGLALVKEIVEHLNGEITVESTQSQGSQFRVFLPLCESNSMPVLSHASDSLTIEPLDSPVDLEVSNKPTSSTKKNGSCY